MEALVAAVYAFLSTDGSFVFKISVGDNLVISTKNPAAVSAVLFSAGVATATFYCQKNGEEHSCCVLLPFEKKDIECMQKFADENQILTALFELIFECYCRLYGLNETGEDRLETIQYYWYAACQMLPYAFVAKRPVGEPPCNLEEWMRGEKLFW